EHDGARARVPRHRPARNVARPRRRRRDAARARGEVRRARRRGSAVREDVPGPARAPQRDGGRRRQRRLDERATASARDRTGGSGPVPVGANLTASGVHVATELHDAGGGPSLLRELVASGLVDGSAPTVEGSTLAEATAAAPAPD